MGVVTSDPLTPELLAAVRGGDRRAFERLFRAWYGSLAEYAARLLGNADTAEDAVQEVFVSVWRRREDLPEFGKLAAYLHRAVRNRALNQMRDQQTAERWATAAEIDRPPAPEADAGVLHAELADTIERAVAELPPRTREVFYLSREKGLTYNEIAAALDISVKTVETLMGRALRALRERLGPHVTGDT
jgi:RNA polymerase sigma-70 factor (ECF subfamily)